VDIFQVQGPLVLTRRLNGMGQLPLKVLNDPNGKQSVAMDPLGAKPGDWVFTIAFSAARAATGDSSTLTDLTVGGVLDGGFPEWSESPVLGADAERADRKIDGSAVEAKDSR